MNLRWGRLAAIGATLLGIAFVAILIFARSDQGVLEADKVSGLKVEAISPTALKVSGLVADSSLGIKSIRETTAGLELNVTAMLTPATKEHDGNLSYYLHVPEPVDRVTFGRKAALIWQRGGGASFADASTDCPDMKGADPVSEAKSAASRGDFHRLMIGGFVGTIPGGEGGHQPFRMVAGTGDDGDETGLQDRCKVDRDAAVHWATLYNRVIVQLESARPH